MSGSRDSIFYQLGKLSSELEGGGSRGSDASVGSAHGGEAGWSGGDVPTPRWGRLLLGVALLVTVAGSFGLLPFGLPTLAAIVLLVVAVAAVVDSVEIVQAYEKRALTVFGAAEGLLDPGLHFVYPFVSKTYQFDMRTEALDVPRQEAITRDNSPVIADAVLYIRVMDAEKAFLGVDDYRRATLMLAQTTLRAVIGDLELDETLSKREQINERIREQLDEPTNAWGIRVEAVEVREVMPSQGVKSAMEQQAGAERRRRAMILEAQGERVSAIERAEGDRAANVIEAEGEKQAQILEAQGDAVSTVLRARAAEAMGERAILLRGMDTLREMGSSPSTTFVIPQELTSLFGRYGRHLTGSDALTDAPKLDSLEFDADTREMLGLDDVAEELDELQGEHGEVDIAVEGVGEGLDTREEAEPESGSEPEAGSE